MLNCMLVGIGGFIGAVLRYLLGMLPVTDKTAFPVVTMGINIAGALAIGLISAAAEKYGLGDAKLILLLKTGLCGGFTTFSTFSLESVGLLESGKNAYAVSYMVLSVVLCVAAVAAGRMLILSGK